LIYRLASGERAVFIGQPKSGKTNLQAALASGVRSFVVIDSKRHPDEWSAWARGQGILVTADPVEINRRGDDGQLANPRLIIQVTSRALGDREGWKRPGTNGYVWTEILEGLQARGRRFSTLVVFDEVIQSMPSGAAHPLAWELFTQGRAFGISCWAGSQIPNRMETLVIRLAEHCFSFWMGNRKDQQILSDARGIDCAVLSTLQTHHFAYHQNGAREWTICSPAPLVLKGENVHTAKAEAPTSEMSAVDLQN
jgi:hypothetical protein